MQADLSPDGRWFGAADDNENVLIFYAQTGELAKLLDGHGKKINGLAFDLTSTRLASASSDGTARIWDVATGDTSLVLQGHSASLRSVRFSPDGGRLLTASSDGTARVWNAGDGEELLRLEGHTDSVLDAIYSPDGTQIVTTSEDKTARIWDALTGKELAIYKGHSNAVNASAFFSEIAEELALQEGAAFGAVFFRREDGLWQFSLRSRGDFRVNDLAAVYGGGGHPRAAGFEVKLLREVGL